MCVFLILIFFFVFREQKLTQLLKECLNSLTCHAAMVAHVSPIAQQYTETLSAVQLASRIHRMRRRRFKVWHIFLAQSGNDTNSNRKV